MEVRVTVGGGVREVCVRIGAMLTYAVISYLRSLARYGSPGLSTAYGFEHPASTPPDSLSCSARHRARLACGLANACALVYVAA